MARPVWGLTWQSRGTAQKRAAPHFYVSSLGLNVTFILNILHRDMSVMAADRKAIAEFPITTSPDMTVHTERGSIVHDYKKITLNSSKSLALGIAGRTQDHYYTQTIERSAGIDEVLWTIRKHMDSFLGIHDRASLRTLTSFTVNQGIASFFDQNADMYFTNTFQFSPVGNQTRLHRGTDEVKIFHAGSGSEYFEKAVGSVGVESFIASTKTSCTLKACISWMQDVYRKVSASDARSGSEAVFMVSSRSNPKFHSMERY